MATTNAFGRSAIRIIRANRNAVNRAQGFGLKKYIQRPGKIVATTFSRVGKKGG